MDPRQISQLIVVSGLLLYLGAALIVDPGGLIERLQRLSLDVEEALVRFRQQLQGLSPRHRARWERQRAWRHSAPAGRPSRWLRILGMAMVLSALALICAVPHA